MTSVASAGIAGLRDDSLPPLHVPLRFFLTAPLFLVFVGGLWLWHGEVAFASRWSPVMLASTHLITLGFFTMIMFGALFQVVPVLGGKAIPRASTVAGVTHIGLVAGAIALSLGLWTMSAPWLRAALVLLATAFAVFVPTVAWCLLRRRAAALRTVRFAGLAFVSTVTLGGMMAAAIAWPALGIAFRRWTDLHAAWGGLGWGLLLVIGVGHQVVPMFHVTPAYPRAVTRSTVGAVVVGLVLLALPPPLPMVGTVTIAVGGLGHAVTTMILLSRRRRRRPDATVMAWSCGLSCFVAALLFVLANAVVPDAMRPSGVIASYELLIAVLIAFGGLGTIVVGMLMKIVPFLAFLHLQRRSLPVLAAMKELPTMAEIVGPRVARTSIMLHLAATAACVVAVILPDLARLAGMLLVADGLWCFGVLVVAVRRSRRAARAIDRAIVAASAVSSPVAGCDPGS